MQELIQLKSSDLSDLREKLYKEQNGLCKICNNPLEERTHIDHQHMTSKETVGENGAGLIRGLVCASCNTFEGKVWNASKRFGKHNDLPNFLRALADYYEIDNLPYIHPTEAPKAPKLMKSSYNKLIKISGKNPEKIKYPKSGKLTKQLEKMYIKYELEPKFYQ